MAGTLYESSGIFRLSWENGRSNPYAAELEALKTAAANVSFSLTRSWLRKELREQLKEAVEDMLGQGENRALVPLLTVPGVRGSLDFEELDFYGPVDLAQIEVAYEHLPGFLRDLKEIEGIDAQLTLELIDLAGEENSILLRWDGNAHGGVGGLSWAERSPGENPDE